MKGCIQEPNLLASFSQTKTQLASGTQTHTQIYISQCDDDATPTHATSCLRCATHSIGSRTRFYSIIFYRMWTSGMWLGTYNVNVLFYRLKHTVTANGVSERCAPIEISSVLARLGCMRLNYSNKQYVNAVEKLCTIYGVRCMYILYIVDSMKIKSQMKIPGSAHPQWGLII
jgi:hypothetical protein